MEQAKNKLTAIMDSVIQLDTLGLLSLFFFFLNDFENPCMADCSAWMIHVFTQILSFLIKTDSFALLVHVPDLVAVG